MATVLNTGTLRVPKRFIWRPKEDITAYELARCAPAFGVSSLSLGDFVDSLPDEAKRHFEVQP